jgi:Cu-Zn family superoxide dismutase
MHAKPWLIGSVIVVAALAFGCTGEETPPPVVEGAPAGEMATEAEQRVAVAQLEPLGDSGVSGRVVLTEVDDGVEIQVDVTGLEPGEHGFHVHEYGDCSAPDGSSAGGHFAPLGHEHGGVEMPSHAGDFGNITANDEGQAIAEMTVDKITLGPGETSVVGRAVIVHAGADDLTTQPAGDSGPRVACGVIRLEGEATEPVMPPEQGETGS